jgi:hypothetical protein
MSVFRVIRIVRKAKVAVSGKPEGAAAGALGVMHASRMMGLNPYLGAAMLSILAFQASEPIIAYYAGALGAADPRVVTGMSEGDRQHQWVLQRIFGAQEGEHLFRKQWGDRQIEVDVRGKLP